MKGFGLFLLSFRPLMLVFFILLFGVRCYEVTQFDFQLIAISPISALLIGVFQDAWFTLLLWLILSLLSFPVKKHYPQLANRFFFVSLVTIVLFQIGFSYYFLLMNQPVDESLFFFSFQELSLIIGLTNRINMPIILLFIVLFYAFIGGVRFLRKKLSYFPTNTGLISYVASFTLAIVFSPHLNYKDENDKTAEALVSNKVAYFVAHSITYFLSDDFKQSSVKTADFEELSPAFYGKRSVCDDQYPLMRPLPKTSQLAPLFKRTSTNKQPDVVFVIVESLSTELVGEYAEKTGHLMPFLDSLSKQALYFPNALSTAQRTHNVLPAMLASVPNVIDGAVFQQIDYPDHFSLFNLLRSSYHTRFYCGVLLEYINMRGFMNYHHVAQLSDKWHPSIKAHSDLVDSPWGIPDNDLFRQAAMDFRKSNYASKSRFDVFLTISTHDPYIYPNKGYYTEKAVQKINHISHPEVRTKLLPKAADLGSFSYTDDALKAFFEREKKSPNYKNTIYVITGDHGSELCTIDPVSNYKVPLLIFSPLLKSPKTSLNIVSHLDIPPTILSFLKQEYNLSVPSDVPFIGKELDVRSGFHQQRSFVFTTSQLKTTDLYENGTFFVGNNCYQIDEQLKPTRFYSNKLKRHFKKQLTYYQRFSRYTINQNKIIPPYNFNRYSDQKIWKSYVLKAQPIKNEKPAKKMVLFSQIPLAELKENELKIEVKSAVFLQKAADLDDFSDVVIAHQKTKWPKKAAVLYKALRPVLVRKFKPNALNEVVFTVQFDPRLIEKLNNKKYLFFYLHRSKARKKLFSHVETIISINKK